MKYVVQWRKGDKLIRANRRSKGCPSGSCPILPIYFLPFFYEYDFVVRYIRKLSVFNTFHFFSSPMARSVEINMFTGYVNGHPVRDLNAEWIQAYNLRHNAKSLGEIKHEGSEPTSETRSHGSGWKFLFSLSNIFVSTLRLSILIEGSSVGVRVRPTGVFEGGEKVVDRSRSSILADYILFSS